MRYCKNCGEELKGYMVTCPECGERVTRLISKVRIKNKIIDIKVIILVLVVAVVAAIFGVKFIRKAINHIKYKEEYKIIELYTELVKNQDLEGLVNISYCPDLYNTIMQKGVISREDLLKAMEYFSRINLLVEGVVEYEIYEIREYDKQKFIDINQKNDNYLVDHKEYVMEEEDFFNAQIEKATGKGNSIEDIYEVSVRFKKKSYQGGKYEGLTVYYIYKSEGQYYIIQRNAIFYMEDQYEWKKKIDEYSRDIYSSK